MLKYKVEVLKKASKDIIKQQPHIRKAFDEWKNNELSENPYTANDGKVIGHKYNDFQIYKKRFGSFRVLFTIHDEIITVYIHKVKSRGQSYKR